MFFTGSAAIYVPQSALSVVALLKYTNVPAMTYVNYFGSAALVIAITLLVVIHAAKTRRLKGAAAEPGDEAGTDISE